MLGPAWAPMCLNALRMKRAFTLSREARTRIAQDMTPELRRGCDRVFEGVRKVGFNCGWWGSALILLKLQRMAFPPGGPCRVVFGKLATALPWRVYAF